MQAIVPPRDSSKYAGQYAGTVDPQRMVDIFADSCRIALSSKNPDTARDRLALAVECFHQLLSMAPKAEVRSAAQQTMENLTTLFPIQVVANEALGLREKARKLKTRRKQLDLLYRARDVVERGLGEHPTSLVLQAMSAELRSEISQADGLAT